VYRQLACLLSFGLFAGILSAQEKPAWTATPAVLYQKDKAYPKSVSVRLFLNGCDDKNKKVSTDLKPGESYSISVTGTGITPGTIVVGDCSLTTDLAINGDAQPSVAMITVRKGQTDDGFAQFYLMDATAGPIPANPQVDVLWEVLVDHVCRDNFGNHMPRDLYCVEVKIGNNSSHPLQLVGVGFYRESPKCGPEKTRFNCTGNNAGISTPNISYQTARASAQAGISITGRNLLVNGTQGIGLLMASFTPYFRNDFNKGRWSTGASIVGTTLAQAINLVAPDQTLKEINNLDDQAFRDGKLIPNNTQVRLLVFVQKESIAEAISDLVPKMKAGSEVGCKNFIPPGYKKSADTPDMCYPAWEDKSFKNCTKKLVCDPIIVKLALGRMIIVGEAIEYIQRVVVDPSVTSQEVNPGGAGALTAQTKAPPKFEQGHGAVGDIVTITGSGFGTTQGTVKFHGTLASEIVEWTDTEIKVKVPGGATGGDVVVTTSDGKSITISGFTIN
jgi:hypothetical protein